MQSYEQFEANCNRMDAELAAEQARQSKFIETLENALIHISINHFPETEQHKPIFVEAITIQAHERAVLLNEVLDMLVGGYSSDKFEFFNQNHVPKRDVSEDEKQYLEKTLKSMPPKQHAYFIELNTERVTIEAEVREFVFLCYDKAKELIVEFFPEIANFSGNSIRHVDCSAYQQMDEWTYDFYYYAGDYINGSTN
ncbi:hypothetical protein [uncultured Acetobacteroides sp.]|uniref:hypothetical protein n=1 Tax=uncultured Acetobacteroides sp. TaxID=1760811 RepID=UPI0029F52EBC|nr:hypothetical protein [uncultured Acetobacteroides sp.]